MITFRKLGRLGRLGNQLFQYAGTRLYAEKNNFKYTLPPWIGNDIFCNIPKHKATENFIAKFLPTVQLNDVRSYSKVDKAKYLLSLKKKLPETIDITELYKNPRNNINLYGYLQDEFSLNKLQENKSKIKEWFRFIKDIDSAYEQLIKDYQPYVGLHIRRGDIIKRNLTIPMEDYIEVLNKIRAGRNLFIATDDRSLLAELKYLKPIEIRNPLPHVPAYIFDFWMLTRAETIIGGGSTFSWWAAFLGKNDFYYSPPLTHTWDKKYKPEIEKVFFK